MTDHIQTVVVGAGVIGTAIARALAQAGHEVLVLEAEESGHHHTSARNSQVIHAGIYYAPGSLKARLCVEGRRMMYDFCATRHVDHVNCGKLIVATTEAQLAELQVLHDRGHANGVDDLHLISGAGATALEPELRCLGALVSPSTGVVDAPGFMRALQGEAEAAGASFATHAPLRRATSDPRGWRLEIGDADDTCLTCANLVNAAGLGSWDVAAAMDDPGIAIPTRNHVKACYFSLGGAASPFERLIYPAPDAASLGVHSLRDIGGQVRFGPSVHFLDGAAIDYRNDVDPAPFATAIRRFWPGLPEAALVPDTCGIRPRITPPGAPLADFMIRGPADHGRPGLVHLFGMESPGLTSSMAIGVHVARLMA
ncbi:NAD(P)/FAD-dependent oxidoreductase [Jannaschia sp. KMU-145]|uniref:NAD(P)/FAD-dependent oxidoreductase n=1 Tax=Jannaschia halovivens TaxID=3388667 RepID=UPI00396AFE08